MPKGENDFVNTPTLSQVEAAQIKDLNNTPTMKEVNFNDKVYEQNRLNKLETLIMKPQTSSVTKKPNPNVYKDPEQLPADIFTNDSRINETSRLKEYMHNQRAL